MNKPLTKDSITVIESESSIGLDDAFRAYKVRSAVAFIEDKVVSMLINCYEEDKRIAKLRTRSIIDTAFPVFVDDSLSLPLFGLQGQVDSKSSESSKNGFDEEHGSDAGEKSGNSHSQPSIHSEKEGLNLVSGATTTIGCAATESVATHPSYMDCNDDECTICGERDCPHKEPFHYHHDGCPACYKDEIANETNECEITVEETAAETPRICNECRSWCYYDSLGPCTCKCHKEVRE